MTDTDMKLTAENPIFVYAGIKLEVATTSIFSSFKREKLILLITMFYYGHKVFENFKWDTNLQDT